MEEIIKIKATRTQPLKSLIPMLGSLGFSKVQYAKDQLIVERVESEDLSGKPYLFYRIELAPDAIQIRYVLPSPQRRLLRGLEMGLLSLNVFRIISTHYQINVSSVYPFYYSLLTSLEEALGKQKLEAVSELNSLRARHISLEKKYKDLVRSSEQNARILVESERKNEELTEKISKMEGLDDEVLSERLFEWIRTHDGEINIYEFGKINSIPIGRVEQGLDLLIKQGYIKRR
ncbi:hypothetical protein JW721_05320 [Candidatus Micrarchaeota archaeon]|nr:hypothetical protein [Candidatus Micrarchaeota archaeon]